MKGKKTGGRVAGTPNKTTSTIKSAIASLLDDYHKSGKMKEDFDAIEDPKDRLALAEKFMQYTTPKMQAVAFTDADEKPRTIEDMLITLSKPKEQK